MPYLLQFAESRKKRNLKVCFTPQHAVEKGVQS